MTVHETEKELRAALRVTRREMKDAGIKRVSCFNGGHSALSYSLNARMFELETKLKALRESKARESARNAHEEPKP